MTDAVRGCVEAIGRCLALLDDLSPEAFSERPGGAASAGEHLRHGADHFARFEAGYGSGVIDYDRRERNPELERDPALCRARYAAAAAWLASLPDDTLSRTVVVRHTVASEAAPSAMTSTAERELAFLSAHTLHHLALAELTLRLTGADFAAVDAAAFSTAAHRAGRAAE